MKSYANKKVIRELHLNNLEEAVVTLEKPAFEKDGLVMAILSNHSGQYCLAFQKFSPEAEIIKKQLNSQLIGKKIAILKMSNSRNPILIRKIPNNKG